ncbi:facilitated trehalose transporter Tret1-like [Palaemon carinicauda]|uniref:facilitated trehalose transporter Tret1-like n=1 Tax=Palaemon carinicauda TaxID=392227 RepID=UPI0035B6AB66
MPYPRARQVVAATSSGMLLTGMMCSWGFPAAALSQMQKPGSVVNFTMQQASWFATVTLLMCIPMSPIGAKASDVLGLRRIMLILTPVLCLSTMMMSAASLPVVYEAKAAETFLLVCRVVQATVTALLAPLITVYIYETTDQHLRGIMTSLVEFWATLGFVLSYVAGCLFDWVTIAWLLPLITLVPAFIGILASPESPFWMVKRGRMEEAKDILALLRCTEEEQKTDLEDAQRKLKNSATCSESVREATKLSNIKAIVASCLALIMKELGGYVVLSIYVVYIFEQAGVGMDPKWSSVIVGMTRMLCNCIASSLWHNFSHRLILIVGNVLIAIGTFFVGIFFYVQEKGEDVSYLSWLPLVGLVVHMIGAAGAIGPGTWALSVEVLPGPVRSFGFGLANTSYAITGFCISKLLLDLQTLMGLKGVFWIFTGGSLSYIALLLLYIPETLGRSPKDIEDYWENRKEPAEDDKV